MKKKKEEEVFPPKGRPLKIMVCIPTEGATKPESLDSLCLMAFHLGKLEAENPKKYEFYWGMAGRILTPLAREGLADYAKTQKMDLVFMIDDDMVTQSSVLDCLIDRIIKNPQVDILAALAFTRVPPHKPVCYTVTEGYDPKVGKEYFSNKPVKNYPKDTLFECDAVGFGAALFKVKILEKMPKPWFMSTTEAGEDIWFCWNAKKYGFRVFSDTAVKIGHLGNPPIITEETFEKDKDNREHRKVYGDYKRKPADLRRLE